MHIWVLVQMLYWAIPNFLMGKTISFRGDMFDLNTTKCFGVSLQQWTIQRWYIHNSDPPKYVTSNCYSPPSMTTPPGLQKGNFLNWDDLGQLSAPNKKGNIGGQLVLLWNGHSYRIMAIPPICWDIIPKLRLYIHFDLDLHPQVWMAT